MQLLFFRNRIKAYLIIQWCFSTQFMSIIRVDRFFIHMYSVYVDEIMLKIF